MTLDDALMLARQDYVILREDHSRVLLWPGTADAAPTVRRVVNRYNREVLQLLREGNVKTCSNPGLHRSYWKHAGQQRYICAACEQLDAAILYNNKSTKKRKAPNAQH
jgi:hypothetical protein